jgi:predicted transcriptional regulator
VIKSNDIFSLDAKHHKLTTLQKPINKGTAQVRVKIEHAFAGESSRKNPAKNLSNPRSAHGYCGWTKQS